MTQGSYTWWPGSWVLSWGPSFNYQRGYRYHDATLQDEEAGGGLNIQFARNIRVRANVDRILERFRAVDFRKTRFSVSGSVNTSRKSRLMLELTAATRFVFPAIHFLVVRPDSILASRSDLPRDCSPRST